MSRRDSNSAAWPVVVALLLAAALWRGLQWHPAVAWVAAVNPVTAWLFWSDKRQARSGGWRVPESTLLLLCFLGGWPGGFLASQVLRHKTFKGSFRRKFWGVVALQIGLLAGTAYWTIHSAGWRIPGERASAIEITFPDEPSTRR